MVMRDPDILIIAFDLMRTKKDRLHCMLFNLTASVARQQQSPQRVE